MSHIPASSALLLLFFSPTLFFGIFCWVTCCTAVLFNLVHTEVLYLFNIWTHKPPFDASLTPKTSTLFHFKDTMTPGAIQSQNYRPAKVHLVPFALEFQNCNVAFWTLILNTLPPPHTLGTTQALIRNIPFSYCIQKAFNVLPLTTVT